MKIFICAILLCFILEGSLFALAPQMVKKACNEISAMQEGALRRIGIGALVMALILGAGIRFL